MRGGSGCSYASRVVRPLGPLSLGWTNHGASTISIFLSAAMGSEPNKLTNKLKILTKLFMVSEKVATKVDD